MFIIQARLVRRRFEAQFVATYFRDMFIPEARALRVSLKVPEYGYDVPRWDRWFLQMFRPPILELIVNAHIKLLFRSLCCGKRVAYIAAECYIV